MNYCRALLLLLVAKSVVAQQTTGTLSGTVADATGATLAGVTVELSGPALQAVKIVTTERDGHYRIMQLPPGDDYKLVSTLDGFQTRSIAGIHVYLGQEGTLNLTLRPAASEEITVSSESPLVDVTKTTSGLNITAKQFATLPTRRSFQALAVMTTKVYISMRRTLSLRTGRSFMTCRYFR